MVFGFSLLESRRPLVNVNAGRLHLISRRCGFMALGRLFFSTGICNPLQWSKSIHYHQRVLVDTGSGSMMAKTSSRLRLRSCLDHCDGAFRRGDGGIRKASAMAPYRHLLSDSHEVVVKKEVGERARTVVNGNDSSKHNGVPIIKELVVAVDVDEVLGSFLAALNKFIADRYSLNHSLSEYYVYEFFKIWNCSRAEADIRVHEFFKTSYFKTGIHPIPGARHTLHKLHAFCKLSVVTSRQNAIKDQTLEWIEKHFPGLFQEIHFGNHFALDGKSRPKSEICRSFGAQVLIDDNPRYAIECAEAGIKVLLFDYDNSYPWCKSDAAAWHPLVTRVHNWQEVEQQLVSWAVS